MFSRLPRRESFLRRVHAALLLVAALAVACHPASPEAAPEVRLAFITGLGGITEPCGCTKDPLGGLDRLATRVEQLRAEGPFELFVVGDTFFEHEDPPGHLLNQEQSRADAIAEALAVLKPRAVLVGARDQGTQRDVVGQVAQKRGLTLLQARRTEVTRDRADSLVITVGGVAIGVLGIPGAPKDEQESYSAAALGLRHQGADFVVALLPQATPGAVPLLKEMGGMNVVMTGGSEGEGTVELADEKLVLDAGDKGRFLGVLHLHPQFAPGASREARKVWRFDDQGKTGRRQAQARIDRLHQDLATLPEGEARTARANKLAQLEAELAAPLPPRPEGSYVTWSLERIDRKLSPAPWARDILARYNRGLCAIATAATAELPCPSALDPRDAFAGSSECGRCHPDALAVYAQTQHAKAWATLTTAGKECDVGCIGCHTLGYEAPGGYCRLADAAAHANVGCESCHGPGATHAAAPHDLEARGPRFVAAPKVEVCGRCHNPEHSDGFDFTAYLPKILGPGHGKPLTAAARSPAAPAPAAAVAGTKSP